jgi:hypothetical protein
MLPDKACLPAVVVDDQAGSRAFPSRNAFVSPGVTQDGSVASSRTHLSAPQDARLGLVPAGSVAVGIPRPRDIRNRREAPSSAGSAGVERRRARDGRSGSVAKRQGGPSHHPLHTL